MERILTREPVLKNKSKKRSRSGKLNYFLRDIPPGLWLKASKQAKTHKISLRVVILRLLDNWLHPGHISEHPKIN